MKNVSNIEKRTYRRLHCEWTKRSSNGQQKKHSPRDNRGCASSNNVSLLLMFLERNVNFDTMLPCVTFLAMVTCGSAMVTRTFLKTLAGLLGYRLRQGYHTGLPHVKPAPENFLLRLYAPAWIIPAGDLLPWMIHFHCPWLLNFVLDMGYTLWRMVTFLVSMVTLLGAMVTLTDKDQ